MKKKYGEKNKFWAIFVTEYYLSSGITYRHLTKTRKVYNERRLKMEETCTELHVSDTATIQPRWLDSELKFATAEDALHMVGELQAMGVLPKKDSWGYDIEVKFNDTSRYGNERKVISIMERPMSDIEGSYRTLALNFWKDNPTFKYDNDHRHQIVIKDANGSKTFLKTAESPYEWTDDLTQALCLAREESNDLCKKVKEETGIHAQVLNLPARHDEQPKFHKWDKVRCKEDDKTTMRMVHDVISLGDGWLYEVDGYYNGASTLYTAEGFSTSPFTRLIREEDLALVKARS